MTCLITFYAQFDAILANRILIGLHIPVRLMPVPRVVSASCGTCVEFELEEGRLLPPGALERVAVEGVFRQENGDWRMVPLTEISEL